MKKVRQYYHLLNLKALSCFDGDKAKLVFIVDDKEDVITVQHPKITEFVTRIMFSYESITFGQGEIHPMVRPRALIFLPLAPCRTHPASHDT